jgi:hypothetical protein
MHGVAQRARGVSIALFVAVSLLIAQVAAAADAVVPSDPSLWNDLVAWLQHIVSIPPG